MSKFIHQSVRLNTSITQAMRCFLIENEVSKWLGKVNSIENKVGGTYHIDLTYGNETWESKTKILEKEFEKIIKLNFNVPDRFKQAFTDSLVEINFMLGTSDTEYCTEIHVLHKGLKDDELSVEAKNFFNEFWKDKLNILREQYNGDWVIEDKDLVLSVLKSSF